MGLQLIVLGQSVSKLREELEHLMSHELAKKEKTLAAMRAQMHHTHAHNLGIRCRLQNPKSRRKKSKIQETYLLMAG